MTEPTPAPAADSGGFFGFFTRGFNRLVGSEQLEVVNPDGGKEDAQSEASKGRFKDEDKEGYFKMMQKYIGADVTSLVTLPVIIFEPMTMLQKMAELMEYSELLNKADETDDPNMRMAYAVAWAVSVYSAYERTWKPFNPILGETYELINHNGVTFINEQVSHHPPMSVGHGENDHFEYDCTSKLKTKFLGNSLDIYPVGRALTEKRIPHCGACSGYRTRVKLKRSGHVLDLVPPPTKVHNLIFGRTWMDSPGDMVLTNLETNEKVVLYFQPCGWFGQGRYEVDGYVYDAAEEPKLLITGKWNESLSIQPCDAEGEPLPDTSLTEIWHAAEKPKNDPYQYTSFAHKLNSFDTAPAHLLPSDSRLRPDRFMLEKGEMNKSAVEKARLEERQRAEKREREKKGDKIEPKWFKPSGEVVQTPWGELEMYEFTGTYWEHKRKVTGGEEKETATMQVADDSKEPPAEFDPWQYKDLSVNVDEAKATTGIVVK